MNKVIRTARISDHPVILPIHVNPNMAELPETTPPEEETANGFSPLSTQVEVVSDDAIFRASSESGTFGDTAENQMAEPGFSQEEVDAIVAEKLKAAEARFQQEKKQAHQTGRDAGYAKGIEEGYKKGCAEGQTQSQDEIVRFQKMLTALSENWATVFKTADINITQIALSVARNIVGAYIDTHSNLILDAVRECLKHLQDKSHITIRVHPDDLELVRSHRSRWRDIYEQIDMLSVEADPYISRGGCLIETPSGDIDAQIESRLEKLQLALIETIRNAIPETPPDITLSDTDLAINTPNKPNVQPPAQSETP